MGEIHLHTKEQQIILDEVIQNDYICSQFYFTKGPALSSIYLHHRYSDDLDFFSKKPLDNQLIFALMQTLSDKNKLTFTSRFVDVVYIFNLTFPNNKHLKIDFAYYPYQKIEKDTIIRVSHLSLSIKQLVILVSRNEVEMHPESDPGQARLAKASAKRARSQTQQAKLAEMTQVKRKRETRE